MLWMEAAMNDLDLAARLDRLLSESLDSVRKRQQNTLFDILGDLDQPFALFGAGQLGRKAATVLQEMGLTPKAFIDNNPALWGTRVQGIPVMSPAQLAEQDAGRLPALIATIWCGEASDRTVDRLIPLRALGFDRIALFGHLAWRFPERFLPHYSLDLPEHVLGQAQDIHKAFNLLADDASRQLFVDHVQWRLNLDYDLLPPASPLQIYFNDAYVTHRDDEVVYDIGAFSGDSIDGYIESGRRFKEIHSFEPSARNYEVLQRTVERLTPEYPGLYAHAMAVGDSVAEVLMEDGNGPASRVGRGSQTVQMSTLDELGKRMQPATFIKIDIEGFEPQCLAGGIRLITEQHPVIAVSVYHQQAHLWAIQLQLHQYYPGYRFSLCPHVTEGWDLVLYAVPADRVPHF